MNPSPKSMTLGLLPEVERNAGSYVASAAINGTLLLLAVMLGMTARHVVEKHYEVTSLVLPDKPVEEVKPLKQIKLPPPEEIKKIEMEAPKIVLPSRPEPPKPVEMEAKMQLPVVKAKPQVILTPQPKAALTAAMPAQNNLVKVSTAPVHLGQTFGVTPNPNATRPATVAAIGNPYGGMNGPAVAPHGVVGSTGIGNGTHSGSNAGVVGRVASAGIPGAAGTSGMTNQAGRVASAGIPAATQAVVMPHAVEAVRATNLEVLSKPAPQYTSEARQLRVEGNVVLRVTFTASGQVVVQGVVRGLGHGLDEEARRVAGLIRFRPATRDGRPVDMTTTITITFQLA